MRHCIGIEDEAFLRGDVPMTKREIRILTLAKARIAPGDVVWDIGAGTGSLSVEAALLAEKGGAVFAIERQAEGCELIRRNAAKFGAANLTVVEGAAPEALAKLPVPDVVLIGGSGKALPEILSIVDEKLKPGGRMVLNTVTVESLYETLAELEKRPQYDCDAMQAQITRLPKRGRYHMAQALNPIAIVACIKH